ncbi:hypothetical protein A3I40_03355 [Candidatus Uhrbacteria bacterium RIFCSPLOWO2_02_FULL_48_12]|uniref:Uncharacterized protein n=1 Tax=Candidatus Uhrbacteria bacterium RIFCSPLOWO2_02_FULL_48_12 TaxID=1802407 RepID=A0A1F7V9R1_9BACT|nr:MAG: hypothetical protein A3I40_03355 [Candidatus Uhrbacteria bacterium RIFCSPLOWO2_02_FULL_48_12]
MPKSTLLKVPALGIQISAPIGTLAHVCLSWVIRVESASVRICELSPSEFHVCVVWSTVLVLSTQAEPFQYCPEEQVVVPEATHDVPFQ